MSGVVRFFTNAGDAARDMLPDAEAFLVLAEHGTIAPGWYTWPLVGRCIPDGDALGPHATAEAAIAGWREQFAERDA